MKKLLIIIAVLFVTSSYGQFKYSENYSSYGSCYRDWNNSSTIIEKKGSSDELFELVKLYFKETMPSKDWRGVRYFVEEELKGNFLEIKIKEARMSGTIYILSIKFKEDRMKIDLLSIGNAGRYGKLTPLEPILYANSKGKKLAVGGKTFDAIDSRLNGIYNGIINYTMPINTVEVW